MVDWTRCLLEMIVSGGGGGKMGAVADYSYSWSDWRGSGASSQVCPGPGRSLDEIVTPRIPASRGRAERRICAGRAQVCCQRDGAVDAEAGWVWGCRVGRRPAAAAVRCQSQILCGAG